MTHVTDVDITIFFGVIGVYYAWKRQKSLEHMLTNIRNAVPVI